MMRVAPAGASSHRQSALSHRLGRFHDMLQRLAAKTATSADIQRRAIELMDGAARLGLLRGRPLAAVCVAALYAAARQRGAPVPLSRLAASTGQKRAALGRYYRILSVGLKLNLLPTTPQGHLPGLCKVLLLPVRVRRRAEGLLEAAGYPGAKPGRSPPAVAAAALYLVAPLEGRTLTEKAVAEAAWVTDVTVRTAARDLRMACGWKFPRRPGSSSPSASGSIRPGSQRSVASSTCKDSA